jgi:hypothetical protein
LYGTNNAEYPQIPHGVWARAGSGHFHGITFAVLWYTLTGEDVHDLLVSPHEHQTALGSLEKAGRGFLSHLETTSYNLAWEKQGKRPTGSLNLDVIDHLSCAHFSYQKAGKLYVYKGS